jgi:hypothetical protein
VAFVTGTDAIVERILTSHATITVVGASSAPFKAGLVRSGCAQWPIG